ncbi:valine--tRNA ligase [Clostridium tetani]|uniref:Valine--tRNA ligase n=1 Tax=Clostridium tetani (strain Massachusetts / E88) TaxID=212717 RepID=SYV_CLOTE|nr:valine--tRNA ligase [Clostridium tetani]Q891R5.1 RecName: Full=Valine--tRNA ligase; AltName: Full=Valyl-tRNA synthetase; Short=ValRS [Clostridium tetani E88]AAO36780.1 valyl-tRNA synthetase [Clostridium tetani E88]KGI39211.1 valyl-tRNA synthetase [Clostridium tetani ATCC 9441]KGI41167.1 valyl-tRNA synthetase [Clostridium tetani]KGI45915.1 valyl-tRNA synthetase [Clostridium tetani]KHO31128.1 valyl-tRNA synthetase [Clostridium tetani]
MNDNINIAKTYDPKEFEERIYKMWEEGEYFTPKVDKDKKPYTIVMPPPNITGKLHLGHALDNSMQDFLIRVKRMQGYSTLWLPGQDHASIATEVKVENELLKTGLKKKEMGREAFLERVWEWSEEYRGRIRDQLKKLGSSADFTRESFTMDDNLDKAVRAVFVKLYEEGLIYKGNRIVNWCPKCMTALSDAEIEYEENYGNFWHVKYPLVDSEEYLEIATTRPETMLGDTAVAVNPNDERYKHLIGKKLMLPLVNREIPIVADDYVDVEFGTGAVKITPAHDPNDYEVGKRHDLEEIIIMNENGTINELGGKYSGMDRYEARKAIVEDLKKEGFLVKVKEHIHNVSCHDRCNTIIEPMISKQWYVKMKELAKPAIEVVKSGEIKFVPERFDKTYFNWMENIQDWCISRQLWWGHRIPVWYCKDCGETIVSLEEAKKCSKCSSENLIQDEDVLDTWFSSALWPFSTLGWPDKTEDLEYFYPTDVLATGYDIIFFWVARMIFSGLHNMKEIPFKTVLIHGIVRDSEGKKMSKSLGNGVDPLEVIDKYGADALRFMLITGNAPGNDIRFYEERVESARNFANKIWNASRYVMMNLDKNLMEKYKDCKDYNIADTWILSRLNEVIKEVTDNIEKFELGMASQKVYDFMWNEFCDWYIELSKPVLYGEDEKAKGVTFNVLFNVLTSGLKLLHPIMPFITEEIFINIQEEEKTITTSKWPEFKEELKNEEVEKKMSHVIEAIKAIRNVRIEMDVPPSRKAKIMIYALDGIDAFKDGKIYFEKLASASEVEFLNSKEEAPENAVSAVTKGAEIYIPLFDLVDLEKEMERLNKEREKLEKEIERVDKKLSNENFVKKAPEAVVNEEKAKGEKYKEMLEAVLERIKSLK